jgi:hypothetical protein
MKLKHLLFIFCTIFAFCSCNKEDEPVQPEENLSPRTVIMYLIADNSLDSDFIQNIYDLEEGLSADTKLPQGTVVVYYDGKTSFAGNSVPMLIKYEVDANGKLTTKREVIKTYEEQNSCNPTVITQVLKDAVSLCPASSYALTIGSHAGGWLPTDYNTRWFGDDYGNRMDIPDLAEGIENSGIHFDYLLSDACLMSQIEVIYELRNAADYLILSPAEVMGHGFPYADVITEMIGTGDIEDEAIAIGNEFVSYYRNLTNEEINADFTGGKQRWATIAVIKSSEIDNLTSATQKLMNEYGDNMSIFTSSKLYKMQYSCSYARSTMAYSSYDFNAFARELTGGNIPSYFTNALEKAVIYKDYVNEYNLNGVYIDTTSYSGVGCYIPYPNKAKWNEYYATLGWNKAVKILE